MGAEHIVFRAIALEGGIAGALMLACGFIAGAIVGSFLALVWVRLPLGRPFVGSRSHCDACARVLGPLEMVPLLSFLWLRGRCRGCGASIASSTWIMELLAGLIGAVAVLLARAPADLVWAVFGWLLLLIAALDLRHYWLPYRLTALLGFAGIAALFIVRGDVLSALAGGAAGFLGLEAVRVGYRWLRGREGLGGGDPLLLGAIGLWTGWQALPFVMIGASLAGFGLVAVWRLRGAEIGSATRIPLGACMAIAAIGVWLAAACVPIVPLASL